MDLFETHDRDRLKVLARQLAGIHPFEQLYPISAKKGRGTDALMDFFLYNAPKRKWDLPPDKTTDKSMIDQAIEVVRECVYQRLHKELPYNIVPIHDQWVGLALFTSRYFAVKSHSIDDSRYDGPCNQSNDTRE